MKRFLPAFLLTLILCTMGLHMLIFPFGRDQGIYSYGGWRMLYGEIPYKDFWDFKPPLIFPIYSLAIAVFGHNMWGIRLFDLIIQTITALLCGWLALLLFNKRSVFFIASLIYGLIYFAEDYWHTAQSDGFATIFVLAALAIVLRWNKNFLSFFLSGLLIGLAFWLKYSLVIFGLPIVLAIWLKGDFNIKKIFKLGIAWALGLSITVATGLLYFRLTGSWNDFVLTEFELAKRYSTITPLYVNLHKALGDFSSFKWPEHGGPLLWTLALLGFLFASKKDAIFNLILAALSSLHIAIQGKLFPYHFWPLVGVMAPIAAFGLVKIWEFLYGKNRTGIAVVLLLVLLLALRPIKQNADHDVRLANVILNKTSLLKTYFEQGGQWGEDFCFMVSWQAAQFLKDNVKPDESFYIWGFEPIIYYLAERKCPSRFIYNVPLFGALEVDSFRGELMSALNSHMPKYIIVVSGDSMGSVRGVPEDSNEGLLKFPELKDFIEENYYKTVRIEDFTFYEVFDVLKPQKQL